MKKKKRIVHWSSGDKFTDCGLGYSPHIWFEWRAKDRKRVTCGNCLRAMAAKRKKGRRA
mgnify:CR=1 FL=1